MASWRDRFLSDRIGQYAVQAIDAFPLLLPIYGVDVSAGFVEMQPGSMGSFPVITIVLETKTGYPSNTAVPKGGWASSSLEIRNAVWGALEALAAGIAPTGNQAGGSEPS